jgi:hypothetical protein
MIVTIIQGLWKEGSKTKKNYYEGGCDQNANKSHHLLYLWQQEKNKPTPSIIVSMIARKKRAHPNHLLYLCK